MDPETEFDTDIMILDYVCSRATHALLLTRIAELSDRPAHAHLDLLNIFDTWQLLVSHKHSATRQISIDLQAKLQLISFTTRFFARARKSKWRDDNSRQQPAKKGGTFSNTAYMTMLEILRIPREERLDDRFRVLSLMDMFQGFLELCATMIGGMAVPDEDGIVEVLGKFIIQAVLEQYTLFGKTASDAIVEASSLLSRQNPIETTTKLLSTIQSSYLNLLHPPPVSSQQRESQETHLNRLAQQFPAFDFESMLIMKLQEFLFGLETPVLVKLETGEMDLYNEKNIV
ncbi:hypothetical protein TSTA_103780 [Talaromyces stipitatus ATCC 10500]|uniref:Uncharacterized protein n=1 Tax=Talaromyces stipitatus (strain ATCC 10500 / CBS 375.48 / QM 6759 / NRRL 1006) TaxID=441959 RepID=B8MNR8_TALSN|nr:uncharacterized protein TSTA_103780 [Talaromyces stipitatus ATCC 10500]EED14157.1 hypothetical protein TSTA_103780 [Talaromyces stipitatus ATCC 10500]